MIPKYPVYVISKGRADVCLTARFLVKDKIPFYLVIEPQEKKLYKEFFDESTLLITPFSELGLGSIPVRNFVKEHSTKNGDKRHWILDDNIKRMYRRYRAKRINSKSGPALSISESFVDRYENIAIAGLNYDMFLLDNNSIPPFHLNNHVYSCILVLNSIPHKWRGRYNEDTDLCLQVLSDGWCTVLINAFCIKKVWTMVMKGGNTDQLYKDDGRLNMSRELERRWPGVVTTVRKFQRAQHQIKWNWTGFDTQLIKKKDIEIKPGIDEFGMKLKQVKPEIKSEKIRGILKEYNEKYG